MKTKQEQIDEMQKTICANCKDKYPKKGYVCPWQDRKTKCYKCEKISEALYNAGYRKIDKLKAENRQLKKENACLLKACEERFTFNTTQNKKYSVFNTVRKVFADEVKDKMFEREYMGVKYKERIFYESEINDMMVEVQNAEDKS